MPYDRAQILVRHVRALCALGNPDSAKKVLEELTQLYPNSDLASQAKALIVQTVTQRAPQMRETASGKDSRK
jgi:hypothetical protein